MILLSRSKSGVTAGKDNGYQSMDLYIMQKLNRQLKVSEREVEKMISLGWVVVNPPEEPENTPKSKKDTKKGGDGV